MNTFPQSVTIETERLVLRPHEISDFEDLFALWSDTDVTRYIFGKPLTQAEVWFRLLRYRGHWSLMGFGYWAVTDRDTGRFLGDAGVANYKRDIEPSLDHLPEAGWVMARHAHGRGFAREAMHAVLAWCDRHLETQGTWAMITPDNTASLHLADKLGYRETRQAMFNGKPRIIVARERRLPDV